MDGAAPSRSSTISAPVSPARRAACSTSTWSPTTRWPSATASPARSTRSPTPPNRCHCAAHERSGHVGARWRWSLPFRHHAPGLPTSCSGAGPALWRRPGPAPTRLTMRLTQARFPLQHGSRRCWRRHELFHHLLVGSRERRSVPGRVNVVAQNVEHSMRRRQMTAQHDARVQLPDLLDRGTEAFLSNVPQPGRIHHRPTDQSLAQDFRR